MIKVATNAESFAVRDFGTRGDLIFRFVVRRLHWLSKVPLAPQMFDAFLVLSTALWNRERLPAIEEIEESALRLPGVRLCRHKFGGVGFAWHGREFGHIHGNGLLDVKVGRTMAETLIRSGRVEPHHVFGRSAWVSFWVRGRADVPNAAGLLAAGLARLTTSRQMSSAAEGRPRDFAARDMAASFLEPSSCSIR